MSSWAWVAAFAAASCLQAQSAEHANNVPQHSTRTGDARLNRWLAIGPFSGAGEVELLDRNLAGASARSEPADVATFATEERNQTQVKIAEGEAIDFKFLYDQPYDPTVAPTAAYLLCSIVSDQPRSAYLMLGSNDALKVWLNGKLVQEQRLPRRNDLYSDALKVELAAGENVLCLKSVRSREGWTAAARLVENVDAATAAALEGHAMIAGLLLAKCVLAPGEPVVFSPRGVPAGATLNCTLRDFAKTWEKRHELTGSTVSFPESGSLPPGLYWAEISAGGRTHSQPFLVGPPDSVAGSVMQQADALSFDEAGLMNVAALKRKVNYFLRPENVRHHRTLVYTLAELEAAVHAGRNQRAAFKGIPGMHMRAFKSQLDDQVQYYRVFVPASYKPGTKLPLAVILPTNISSVAPFIESAFMRSQSEAERLSVIAEKYQLALVWCGYRKEVRADPCEFAHINEVIAAVSQDYAIDQERISLCGACSAGVLATTLVAREPRRFAAVALHNAVFGMRRTTSASVVRSCYASPSFRQWALKTDALDDYLARCDTPVLLVHDGAVAGHGDLVNSLGFTERGKRHGKPVELERVPQTVSQHFGAWDRILGWLSQVKRINTPPATAAVAKTIDEVFTTRFSIISGTRGSAEEQLATARLRDRFKADWRAAHFGDCRSENDRAHAIERTGENLVLIGNDRTSATWAKEARKFNLSLEPGRIRVGAKTWEGKDLSIQIRLDDPETPGRSVVFVGGSDLSTVNPATMNLAMDGWYQFAVWDPQGKLVDAGTL